MEAPLHLFDLDLAELRDLIVQWQLPHYRADQLMSWVYQRGVCDLADMTDISKGDRQRLGERLSLASGRVETCEVASDGVRKLLLSWPGFGDRSDDRAECVMIPSEDQNRNTACISSQVGCAVGCRFCASGIGGLDGNLRSGKIVEQVWQLAHLESVERVTNVVFMGMGEPLANFDQVVRAVRILNAPWGMGISARRMTISTVGLPAQIRRLADEQLSVTLAISLHAPNDQVRRQLIPWAQYVTIDALLEAGRYYFDKTGREVTLEYILLHRVNDQPEHARELARIAGQLRSNVNLIRYNEVSGLPFSRPDSRDVYAFEAILRKAGVNTHVRASRGRDITAACGQLRHNRAETSAMNEASPMES